MVTVINNCYAIMDHTGCELVRITIEHRANGLNREHLAGQASAQFQYPTKSPWQGIVPGKYTGLYNWSSEFTSEYFILRITDFILPLQLRRRGIGTLCWSLIYSTLPTPPKGMLLLHGGLSSVDASIPGENHSTWQFHPMAHRRTDAYVDNITRRNNFWLRMLDPINSELVCDARGNGHFRGLFVDPASHPSFSTNLVITQI